MKAAIVGAAFTPKKVKTNFACATLHGIGIDSPHTHTHTTVHRYSSNHHRESGFTTSKSIFFNSRGKLPNWNPDHRQRYSKPKGTFAPMAIEVGQVTSNEIKNLFCVPNQWDKVQTPSDDPLVFMAPCRRRRLRRRRPRQRHFLSKDC